MAVAHDAVSESHTGTTGSASEPSFTWTHTPVGTPRGVLVFTFTSANADDATAVTYGGVSMTAVAGGRAVDTATEPGDCKAWFLGASIPTGAQSVVVTRNHNANVMYGACMTQTAAADTSVTGVTRQQENQAPAQVAVNDGSPGSNSVRYAGGNYGGAAIPIAGAASTALVGIDLGARAIGVVRETTAGQGARNIGFADVADDWACVLLAVREGGPVLYTQGVSGSITASGALFKQINKSVAGAATGTGSLSKFTSRDLLGTIVGAGVISRFTTVGNPLTGSITPSGTLGLSLVFTQVLSGSITAVGQVWKLTMKRPAGSITGAGSLSKSLARTVAGTIVMTGLLAKSTRRLLTASITPAGTSLHAYFTARLLTGTITLSGFLQAVYQAYVVPPDPLAPLTFLRRFMGRR